MEQLPIWRDDREAILQAVGPLAPIILREAMDNGLDAHRRSRDLDPVGFADYRPSTLANTMVDRMYPFLRDLVEVADPGGQSLLAKDTKNGRATEVWIGGALYVKLKRVHDRTRLARPEEDMAVEGFQETVLIEQGGPRNVKTHRVVRQLYPKQPVLPGNSPFSGALDESDRLCLVAAFDLDEAEEQVERPRLGDWDGTRWRWSEPLEALESSAIGVIHPRLGERVEELRQRRGA